jgi:hypothetical protein
MPHNRGVCVPVGWQLVEGLIKALSEELLAETLSRKESRKAVYFIM